MFFNIKFAITLCLSRKRMGDFMTNGSD